MFGSSRLTKMMGAASVAVISITAIVPPAVAAPMPTMAANELVVDPLVEQVQARRRPVPVAKARRRNNNAAAAAAIVGIGVLGIAAAAAAAQSQPRRGQYYTDQWGNPVDAYGRPVYSQRPVQYYEQPGYNQQPGYYEQPGYYRQPRELSRWEKDQHKARVRAEREQALQAQRQQQRWTQEQQWRQQRGGREGWAERDPRFGGGYVTQNPFR